MRSQLIAAAAVILIATPAFADIAVDPCEGAEAGAACALPSGGSGVCASVNGSDLTCTEAAANNGTTGTNNGTAATTNNGTAAATNNKTAGEGAGTTTASTTGGEKAEKSGCSTASAGGLLPSLFAFVALVGFRRRR